MSAATPPGRPWATPPAQVSPPSAWPAPFASQPVPKAELVTAPEARALAPRPPKTGRPVARFVILGLAVLAAIGVFRRSSHHVDPAAALRAAQVLSQQAPALGPKQDTVPEPPTPPGVESAEDAKRELTKGFEQVKQSIRDALKDDSDEATAPVENAKAKGPKEERGAATPAEASQLLSDADDALDEEDPKLSAAARRPELLRQEDQRRLGHQGPGPLPAQGLGQRPRRAGQCHRKGRARQGGVGLQGARRRPALG